MQSLEQLSQHLADAYEHLYDIAYLRSHPVGQLRPMQADQSKDAPKDRGWQVHHALIKAIDDLNPGGRAPAMSREWRKHRLMRLRYIDGLSPQEVADALAVSRRQYYRVHDEAVHTLAQSLWSPDSADSTSAQQRTDLLRVEMERHSARFAPNTAPRATLTAVVDSALSLLHERLSQRSVRATVALPAELPPLRADEKLFRQLLLSLMDFLVERSRSASMEIGAAMAHGANHIDLTLKIAPAVTFTDDPISLFAELAALNNAQLSLVAQEDGTAGFRLQQPVFAVEAKPVLAVDDNEDTLELYRRYLEPQGYTVRVARNSAEVFDTLLDTRPQAIFLDLMLPDQDGWDILQLLKNEPDARDIPVFICSVLKQKELALSLGATGFVEKPFSQTALLAALAAARS